MEPLFLPAVTQPITLNQLAVTMVGDSQFKDSKHPNHKRIDLKPNQNVQREKFIVNLNLQTIICNRVLSKSQAGSIIVRKVCLPARVTFQEW